ncbi:MAG: rhomboid family intramembrane serine protease [Candidatus Woesearchaeota archaeon]
MKKKERINSETTVLWKVFLKILLTPITIFLVLFGKKNWKKIFEPITILLKFIFEARLTITLIIINIILYFISFLFEENLFLQYPTDFISNRFYTLITSGFMHANLTHLIGNMVALFVFGRVVEKELGYKKTFIIYFGALLISGIFFSSINLIMNNNIPGIGASGAIMGLIAAAILLDPFYITFELIIPLPIMIVGWIAIYMDIIGILNPVNDGIGHIAHIGGFLSISIILFLLEKNDRQKIKKGFYINIFSAIIATLIYFLLLK